MDSIPHLSTEGDIHRYVLGELSDLEGMNIQKVSSELARGSDGLFEWARLACAFVKNDNVGGWTVEERFQRVLSRNKVNLLDGIYLLTLEAIFPKNPSDSTTLPRFQSVMAQIIATAEPLPLASLKSLRRYFTDWKESDVDVIVRPMGALLTGTTDHSVAIRPLHASFLDFLSEKERSGEFYVDFSGTHDQLAFGSLRLMKDCLRFNICKLQSSYLRNSKVPDLAERIKENISPELSYSCRFWTDHLQHTHVNSLLAWEVESFFNHERLLFWFEVLSLEKKINTCISSLSSILDWAEVCAPTVLLIETGISNVQQSEPGCRDIYDDAIDAQKFIRMFGGAISSSTPHLYVSALPFSPRRSTVSMKFLKKFNKVLRISHGHNTNWPGIQGVLVGHTGYVWCVAFSSDGKRIVSGSDDKTIRLWDAETGEQRQHLEGHQHRVSSVGFSPEGRRIVSGSYDKTIRLWDAETGEQLGQPLEHQDQVWCVGFSPDGRRIVSGSYDRTIRLWDAEIGRQLGKPLEGHQDGVPFVEFSPDGRHIVSGSYDKTIRLWCTETGEQLGQPLEGHQDGVRSVAFSPEGKRVVSGSDDKTIRLWDAEGELPWRLKGHHLIHFASPFQHALFEPFELAEQVASSRSSKLEDLVEITNSGWVCIGPLHSLLFWAPPSYHPQWYPLSMCMIIPMPDVQLDLSNMAHGSSWDLCYNSQEETTGTGGLLSIITQL